MIVINIYEAKAKLSEYLDAAGRGERVLICNRNRPVAELRAVEPARTTPRPIGGTNGVVVPPAFFDPLPDDLLDAFEGKGEPHAEILGGRPVPQSGSRATGRRTRARR